MTAVPDSPLAALLGRRVEVLLAGKVRITGTLLGVEPGAVILRAHSGSHAGADIVVGAARVRHLFATDTRNEPQAMGPVGLASFVGRFVSVEVETGTISGLLTAAADGYLTVTPSVGGMFLVPVASVEAMR